MKKEIKAAAVNAEAKAAKAAAKAAEAEAKAKAAAEAAARFAAAKAAREEARKPFHAAAEAAREALRVAMRREAEAETPAEAKAAAALVRACLDDIEAAKAAAAAVELNTEDATGAGFAAICENMEAAAALVRACMTTAAWNIENKAAEAAAAAIEAGNTKAAPYVPAMETRYKEAEEIEQDTFYHCFDRMDNPRFSGLPIALYVVKAASKAINARLYNGAKIQLTAAELKRYYPAAEAGEEAAPDAVIDGRIASRAFPAPGDELIREDFRGRVLDNVAEARRPVAAAVVRGLEAGYSVEEAAEAAGVSRRTGYRALDDVKAAAAVTLWEDGDYNRFERLISSDEKAAAALARREAAAEAAAEIHSEAAALAHDMKAAESHAARIVIAARGQAVLKREAARHAGSKAISKAPAPVPAAVIPTAVIERDRRYIENRESFAR